MDELKVTASLTPLDQETIEDFERNLDIVLPSSYRTFLLQYNGGHPQPNMFPIQGFYADTHGLLEWFFCIAEGDVYDLVQNKQVYKNRAPSDLLPIGTDPGGNLICLGVKGKNYGKIYYWDHETEGEEGEQPTYDNVYFVADSFDDLLQSLADS